MTTRSEALATTFEGAVDDFRAAVEASTPEQWAAPCTDSEWTQAFAAYHAANAIGEVAKTVKNVAEGNPFPNMTMQELDAQNAEQAKQHADCTVPETIGLINASASDAANMVRSLTDDQLDRKVQMPGGMPEISVDMLVQMGLIGHVAYHLQTVTGAR